MGGHRQAERRCDAGLGVNRGRQVHAVHIGHAMLVLRVVAAPQRRPKVHLTVEGHDGDRDAVFAVAAEHGVDKFIGGRLEVHQPVVVRHRA